MAGDTLAGVRALAFDVFGTVVDWRSTVIREGEALGRARGVKVDWAALAEAWRDGYQPAMDRVRRGELPWTNIDESHRMNLDDALDRFGIRGLRESELGWRVAVVWECALKRQRADVVVGCFIRWLDGEAPTVVVG